VDGAGCNGSAQRVYLDVNSSPSLWKLVSLQLGTPDGGVAPTTAQYAASLNAAFQPIAGKQFIVRVAQGNTTQYAATCTTLAAGWAVVNGNQQAYVDLDPNTKVVLAGMGGGTATINPIQIVHWQIQAAAVGFTGDAGDATKYDLTRQFVDAKGNLLGSAEVVAEYAVDLKFGFTVDNTNNATTGNFAPGTTSSQVVLSLEDATTNGTVGGNVTTEAITAPTTSLTPAQTDLSGPQPQRIRSVRIRLATRAEQADRNEPLSAGAPYLYRYCTAGSATQCLAGAPVWARTRTEITEVALLNQARLWYR
jgi:hypothetical protein